MPVESHSLQVGQWSAPVPLVSMAQRFSDKFFLTITAGHPGKTVDRIAGRHSGYSTDVVFEFEFRFSDEVVKRFTTKGPDGGIVTIVIPFYRLVEGVRPNSHAFTEELTDVLENALAHWIKKEFPWIGGPRICKLCADMILEVVHSHIRSKQTVCHGQRSCTGRTYVTIQWAVLNKKDADSLKSASSSILPRLDGILVRRLAPQRIAE